MLNGSVRELPQLLHRPLAIKDEALTRILMLTKSGQPQCRVAERLSRRRVVIARFDQRHMLVALGGRQRGEPAVAIVPQDNQVVPHDGLFSLA